MAQRTPMRHSSVVKTGRETYDLGPGIRRDERVRAMSDPVGYSGKPIAAKIGIKPGDRVSAIDAPAHYAALLAPLPEGAEIVPARPGNGEAGVVVHAFVRDRAQLEALAPVLAAWPPLGGMIWISWPKKASPMFRDLTEEGVREVMLPTGWVDVKVAAIDADWSGLKFLRRRA